MATLAATRSDELRGVIVAIRDRRVLVDLRGDLLPRAGDPVEFFDTGIDDIGPVPVPGTWHVEGVDDGIVEVAWSTGVGAAELTLGLGVRIHSSSPIERPAPAPRGAGGSIGARASPLDAFRARGLRDDDLPAAILTLERRPRLRDVAEHAGLREGDIVLAVDGEHVGGPYDFDRRVRRAEPGSSLVLDIARRHAGSVERLRIEVPVVPGGR